MPQVSPDSSQHATDRREISQRPQLRPTVPLPRSTGSQKGSLAVPLAGRAEAIQRADSGYSTAESLSSPLSASPPPTAPVSDGGYDLEAGSSYFQKQDPSSRYSRAEAPVPAPQTDSPPLIDFEHPTQDSQFTSSHNVRTVGLPPKFSSSVPPAEGESSIKADPRYLANKSSSHRYPSQPPPSAFLRQDPPLPPTPPASTTGYREHDIPERPSNTAPPSSSQLPVTGGGKNPDAQGGNVSSGVRSGNSTSRALRIDGAGQFSLPLATVVPAPANEARVPARTQAPPGMYSSIPSFPTPPTPPSSPKAPGDSGEYRPSLTPLHQVSQTNSGNPSSPPIDKAAPKIDSPPQVLPSRTTADRESPAPGNPVVNVVDSPVSSLYPLPQTPPPPRPLTSLGLWRHLQNPPTIPSARTGAPQPLEPQEVPAELRVIFGLHCKTPATTTGAGVMQRKGSQHGAGSLEGVWKLADIMTYSSIPIEAFKQFPEGQLFSITPARLDGPCPLQQRFKGTGAISNELADKLCSSFGVDGLLDKLNGVLGTRYQMNKNLSSLLTSYVNDNDCDFGQAYGEVRRGWFCDVNRLQDRLRRSASQDLAMRRRAINPERGLIVQPRTPPRRVWDLYSNRVLDFWVLLTTDMPKNLWAVSHSWVEDKERKLVRTRINGYEWAIPIPHDVELDQVRIELLNLGAEYVWLDVLCLRQQVDEKTRQRLGWDFDTWHNIEVLRQEEWRLDVPTIGHVFRCKPSQVVITYFSGLGRPFCVTPEMFAESRSWLNRVWTMQETTPNWLLGGLMPEKFVAAKGDMDLPSIFHARICNLLTVLAQDPPDLFALAKALQGRHGTNPIDRVSALGLLLKCPALPIYDIRQPCEGAWDQLLQQMSRKHRTDLLVTCLAAGDTPGAKWRPSWAQLMEKRSIPPKTRPIDYSEGELLNCRAVPRDVVTGPAVVYWNYAYVIESCSFTHEPDGTYMHATLGPVTHFWANDYKTAPFRIQTTGARFDPSVDYAAVGVADLEYWVLGKILDRHPDLEYVTFEKIAVFQIPDAKERERLWHLNPGYSDTPIHYL